MVLQLPAPTYEWLGCTAAQLLAELEQQLSMLVQGLVKARSDAVDGDGAAVSATETDDADDSSAADTAVAATVPPTPPCLSLIDATAAGAAGALAPAEEVPSLLDFLALHELQDY
jgi:hypothetical protein